MMRPSPLILLFSTTTEVIRVPADYIVYISADGNYSTLKMADGGEYVLTLQLGHMERRISEMIDDDKTHFIRIGKSLIVNLNYISYIHPTRQKVILSDSCNFRHELSASKEALRKLKDFIEQEVK